MENKYSHKTKLPTFEPTGKKIRLDELVSVDKYVELIREINQSLKEKKITENQAKFLKLAATRWVSFMYDDIAEYYCTTANEEMQRLMKRSALVLLDVDDAFANNIVATKNFVEDIQNAFYHKHPNVLEEYADA